MNQSNKGVEGGKPEVSSFEAYAKKFYDFTPSKEQAKFVEHVIKGDKIVTYLPVGYGKSNFNKMAKAYIDHYNGKFANPIKIGDEDGG